MGTIQADQDTSFQAMQERLLEMIEIVKADPAIATFNGFTGGGGGGGATTNTARMFISLKPLEERKISVDEVIARLRPKLARVPGADALPAGVAGPARRRTLQQRLLSVHDARRQSSGSDRLRPAHAAGSCVKFPSITDVNTDQQNNGLQAVVKFDRRTAARFGISPQLIDNTLYDVFGQRQVSTMYTALNQYHVVMEAAPEYWQDPQMLREVYVRAPNGQQVPLNAITHFGPNTAPLAVNHQGLFPAVTISFNLAPGVPLGDAVDAIEESSSKIGLPPTIHTTLRGNGAGLSGHAREPADPDRRGAGDRVHRAGRAV